MDSTSNTTNSKSSDVSKLISLGFDEAQAIQALNEHGSLQGAIDLMTSGGADMRGRVSATVDGPASQSRSELDTVNDPSQKLIDDHDNENKVSLPTDLDVATGAKSHSLPTKSDKGNNADAPSPSLPKAARVEQIEENEGPEPPVSMQPAFQNNSKKLSSLTARVEQVEDYDGPEPPLAMMTRFQDSNNKKSARFDNEPNRSSPLIGGRGQDVAVSGSNMETTDTFLSFDSLEGQNFFRDNTNNITTNNERTRAEDESVHKWNAALRFPRQVDGVDPNIRSGPVDEFVNTVVADEEKSNSVNSKSDSDQQEAYVAIIPEAFLVEEEQVEGEIIQATLIEPTPPWWKMRQMQLMLCFVIILVLALSISLGRNQHKNEASEASAVPPALSLSPSSASIANAFTSPSPSAVPSCSLDSNCGAKLEIWTDIAGSTTYDLRYQTNALSNEPNQTKRLWSLLEAPTNIGDNYGLRIKGWLKPPVTGNYTFWIASNDSSELWLSTDENPANVELACYDYSAVDRRARKTLSEQESLSTLLVGNKEYYFQALLKEGEGLDHLAIAWKYPGQEMQVIPAEYSKTIGPSINEIIPGYSLIPSIAPTQPVNCSIDSYCGAILETWTDIDAVRNDDFMFYTDQLTSPPNKTERLWDLMEVPSYSEEKFGDNMNGWLVPPVSGDYLFWISSDDNGEFFLNSDYGHVGDVWLMRICQTPEYSGFREWDKSEEQKSDPIALVAGQPYYFEIRRTQGVRENHLSVAWQYPGQSLEVIPAKYSRTTSLDFTCLECGATLDIWMDIEKGRTIDDLRLKTNNLLSKPTNVERLWTLLEAPSNQGYNLGKRMKGWLMPPVTGNYSFWIAADDIGEFWLSKDDDPKNVFRACRTPVKTYGTYSRAWTWFPHQESSPIWLVAGRSYYFEALMKQSEGYEFLAIAWRYSGHELQVIPAKYSRITNPSDCLDSNCGAELETWTVIPGRSISELMSSTNNLEKTPNRRERLSSLLEIVANQGENYGIRMTGWFIPPESGDYIFWIASDDTSELRLSTDDDPTNKDIVCNCTSAVGYREWNAAAEQRSAKIQLIAGQAYYFEAVMKEARYGDHFSLAWEYPGQYREVIPAKFSRRTRP